MTPTEAVIVSAIITGVLAIAGVVISAIFRARDTTFTSLISAYEAISADLERERAESVKKDGRLKACQERIEDLNRQLAECYGRRRRGEASS